MNIWCKITRQLKEHSMRIYVLRISKSDGIILEDSGLVQFPIVANKNPVFKKAVDVI